MSILAILFFASPVTSLTILFMLLSKLIVAITGFTKHIPGILGMATSSHITIYYAKTILDYKQVFLS